MPNATLARINLTFGTSTMGAAIESLDNETTLVDGPTWPRGVDKAVAFEWAKRAAAQRGLVLVRGPIEVNRSGYPARRTVTTLNGRTVWLD